MKVVPSNAITAVICLGQSFIANQSIPTTFLSRIQTVTSFLLGRFTLSDPSEVKSLPDFLILSGSDVKNNGITEARFMLDQINERLEVSKLVNPITTWNLTTDQTSQSDHQTSLKVILEEESKNTLENILYCYDILEKYHINKIYLVTSDFHTFRSLLLTKMIWSQSSARVSREVIPIIAHSNNLPHNNQLTSNNPKLLQSLLKSFVSRITSLFSFLINPKTFLQSHSSKQIVNTCTIDQLQSYYRPWEHRPKDISEWTIMEKLDLEKKAILSMQENFRKYPKLAHLTIPQEDIQRTLDDLHRFNETLIQQYTQQTSTNSSDNKQLSGSYDFPKSSSFLSSLLSTSSSFVTSL